MTLLGVLARGRKTQAKLRARQLTFLSRTFPSAGDRHRWWIAPDGAVALYDAVVIQRGEEVTAICAAPASAIAAHWSGSENTIASLSGPFALACWDSAAGRLVLARDHIGQRQLYYRRSDDYVLFSSSLQPLLDDPAWSGAIDHESAIRYLLVGQALPARTLARGIESVPAAHMAVWDGYADGRVQRYWTPLNAQTAGVSRHELVSNIRDALNGAIRRALPETLEPAAILLSGGVDSSYVAAVAAKAVTPEKLAAYTIRFDPDYGQNEVDYASTVAAKTAAVHHVVPLSADRALPLLRETLASPVPCSAWSTITHHRLLSAVSAGGPARLLSGLGSDEVFGSFDRYLDYYFRQRRYAMHWTGGDADWFDAILADPLESRERLFPGVASFFTHDALRKVLYAPFSNFDSDDLDRAFYRECRQIKPDAHSFEMMVAHELQHRVPDLLMSNFEPVAQRNGIETRYPFLDPALAKWASFIGPSDRYWYERGAWWAKKLFREIAREQVSPSIIMRVRAQYDAPLAEWLAKPSFAGPVLDELERSRIWDIGLLRPRLRTDLLQRARRLPRSLERTTRPWMEELWVVWTLAAWFDRYVDRKKA